MNWLGRILDRDRFEKELDAELRFDFEERVAASLREGMSEAEARRRARLDFGGMDQVKEECRDVRRPWWFGSLFDDVRYAARGMRRSPAFAMVAVLTLAVGIGINATVFTVANAVLFKGFPFIQRNDRLVYLDSSRDGGCCLSYPDFEDWRAQAKSFTAMATMRGVGVVLSDENGLAERYDETQISAGTFSLIGQRPVIGRDFEASDEAPGAPPVAILDYGFWERRYAKDPAVIGRVVRINGTPTTVIGVMGQGVAFPQNQDLWVPLDRTPELQRRDVHGMWVAVARLADGASVASARAEMQTIGRRLEAAYPRTNAGVRPRLRNFHEFFIGPDAGMIYGSMWGAVGFVLLIACANLANLLLARAIGRAREISVRIALGSGRWRIIRQLLIESLMLSGLGGLLGWCIAKWGIRLYQIAEWPSGSRPWRVLDYTMDARVLWYLVGISIATGLLFGLAPALRLSKLDVNAALKDGGRGASGGGRGKHLSALLVIGEMALAVVLLAGAGVMIRSFLNIYTADLGVKTGNILTMDLGLPALSYPTAESQIAFFNRLRARLETIPGVESTALANRVPASGAMTFPIEFAGGEPIDAGRRPIVSAVVIGPGYFQTLGSAVPTGRDFNDFDGALGMPVAIVNQKFAAKYWPGADALGRRLRVFENDTPGPWLTVVGVAPNIVQDPARQRTDPLIYLSYQQKPSRTMAVMARTRVAPASLVGAFRREQQALDPDLPVFGPSTLEDRLVWNYWNSGFYGGLFLIFAAIALLLASVGLYAVIAHSVSRRTQEIGIRMAIGASTRDILRLVYMQGMLPLGVGLGIGLIASLALTRILKAVLVHVSPADPVTFGMTSIILILAATLGCWIPARRAMRVDPVVALRHE